MAAAEFLAGALLAARLAGPPQEAIEQALHASDRLLTQLLALQTRVRGGELVPMNELALAAPTREELLADFDVRAALRLGVEPAAVRERLVPGFAAELERLAAQREALESGPPKEPSPLLALLLDFELELKATADRRRQGLGLKNPLDAGPLATNVQPNGPPGPAVVDGVDVAAPVAPGRARVDPRVAAPALYRAGRWQEALDEFARFPPAAVRTLEEEHQRADCLLRVGEVDAAIQIWEALANDHAGSTWGQQAAFSLKVARAMAALKKAKPKAAGGAP